MKIVFFYNEKQLLLMALVPKFPEFRISKTPNENLRKIAVKLYSDRFEELRTANFKLSKVLESKIPGGDMVILSV